MSAKASFVMRPPPAPSDPRPFPQEGDEEERSAKGDQRQAVRRSGNFGRVRATQPFMDGKVRFTRSSTCDHSASVSFAAPTNRLLNISATGGRFFMSM